MKSSVLAERWVLTEAPVRIVAGVILILAVLLASRLIPNNTHFFRPNWLLHPDETGYLITAQHLAKTGSFVIEDEWYAQNPTHVPPGVTEVNGKLVPKKAIGGYMVYAVAYRISNTAWLYVGPLFGILASLAAGALVYQRTRDWLCSTAATVILATSSPLIGYATGLAFADIIAVAALLWGCFFLSRHLEHPSWSGGLVSAACMGFAALTRLDFAVVTGLAMLASLVYFQKQAILRRGLLLSLPGLLLLALVGAAILVSNDALYGSPFKTGYVGGWQESPAGVAGSLTSVSLTGLLELSNAYLLRIGLPATMLLIFGLATKNLLGNAPAHTLALDFVFLGAVLFELAYFLGRPGAYGTGEVWLVSSYPRYILLVYALGIVWGTEGLASLSRHLNLPRQLVFAVVLGVGVIAVSISLREAFLNERGVDYIERLSERHSAIARIVDSVPGHVIVVSDLNSKVVLGDHTITPNSSETGVTDTRDEVLALLRAGDRVVLIGDQRDHPLYSGYIEELQTAGVQLQRWACTVEIYEAVLPGIVLPSPKVDCPSWAQALRRP